MGAEKFSARLLNQISRLPQFFAGSSGLSVVIPLQDCAIPLQGSGIKSQHFTASGGSTPTTVSSS
jgi:hypothetical protein